MSLRNWAAWTAMLTAAAVTTFAFSVPFSKETLPPSLAAAGSWAPGRITFPPQSDMPVLQNHAAQTEPALVVKHPTSLTVPTAAPAAVRIDAPLTVWRHEISPGETLDTVLKGVGLAAGDRAEITLALGAEYNLRRLRPGHKITVESLPAGSPRSVILEVDDGVQIEVIFGEQLSIRTMTPEPEVVTRAGEAYVEHSIFSALKAAEIPSRFAVDLAQILGGTVDFRRDLGGGETLRLMWREARVDGEVIGQPKIVFAALSIGGATYEVIWPEDELGQATIYLDGDLLRVSANPVGGARLTSVFGRRRHPIYGDVRMHTGVDFAAARGAPVHATAPGRIAFIGWRGGYGRVIEIAHGSGILTRYAHLSAASQGLAEGQRVLAGDEIGYVGATGTATAPNLHYEVRVDGRPTDPLADERLVEATANALQNDAALARLRNTRVLITSQLAAKTDERP